MDELMPYIRIVLKRLWLIALLVLVTVGGIYVVESTRPPRYQASVRLQVLTVEPEEVALFTPLRYPNAAEQIERTGIEFMETLRNRDVAWEAAREINKELGTNLTADDIIKSAWPGMAGEFIQVTYVNVESATLAKRMADVHIQKALEHYRRERTRGITEARLFIEQQVQQQAENLSQARDTLGKFLLKYNLTDIRREAVALQDQIRALELERDRAQIEIDRLSASVQIAREKAESLRKEAVRIRDEDADRADDLIAQANALDRQSVADEIALEAQRAALASHEHLITRYKNRLAELIGLQGEYDALVNSVRKAEDHYAFLVDKLNEAKTKEAQALHNGYIRVVQAAREPVQPAPKRTSRLVFYGAALAAMLGIGLSFLLEVVERLSARPRSTSTRQEAL